MGSLISRSLASSLEDSDSDCSNQIEGHSNTNTAIRTKPTVTTEHKNQQKNEGSGRRQMNTNSNWTCSTCALTNVSNANKCKACFAPKSSNNNQQIIWCWQDNNGSYIQYPTSISHELNELNVGNTYTLKIEKITYQIKKTSNTQCQQTNIKTKRKRLVVQQNIQLSMHMVPCHDDVKIEPEPGSQTAIIKNQQKQQNDSIQSQLSSMGFAQNYIKRAVKVYDKNYGHSYNVEVLTEIIVRLQSKDEKIKNKRKMAKKEGRKTNSMQALTANNGNISKNDFPPLPLFDAMQSNNSRQSAPTISKKKANINVKSKTDSSNCEMKTAVNEKSTQAVHKWTCQQLTDWINSLDMLSKVSKTKIISGIEEFQITAVDFISCQNGQEIAETFDIETNTGNLIYAQIQNLGSCHNQATQVRVKCNAENKAKSKKRKHTISTTWKSKKVRKWSCQEMQDWVCSLDALSQDSKNKFISGIKASTLSGADFVLCRNGEDFADSFEGISIKDSNVMFAELSKV